MLKYMHQRQQIYSCFFNGKAINLKTCDMRRKGVQRGHI